MCGIAGVISQDNASLDIYESLISLQHRGQDGAGMVTYSDKFHLRKGKGLVREVFDKDDILRLKGNMGLGQVRYPTMGSGEIEELQPYITDSPYGIALTHNGNIYNYRELRKELFQKDLRKINSNNDAEVILHSLASSLSKHTSDDSFDNLCKAVESVFKRVKGGYSVVAVVADKGLIAFRDPHGIRPLVWGVRNGNGKENIFASENTMFEILGFDLKRDVKPGELIFINQKGNVKNRIITQKDFLPCIFEYVYFARPDAILNKVSVYRSRLRMGQNLAEKIKKEYPNLDVDVVIPAPETSTTAALSCAHELGVRYTEGLVKNRFIGRTFIMPGQKSRREANKYKLSVIKFEVKDKNVLVVDDSIVRGNVSRHIIKLMRKHGAKKVYFASASPPLRWPDIYGMDLPTREEYIAHNRTEDEIEKEIAADLLIYQDLGDLVEAVTRKGDLEFKKLHTAYFDGDYPDDVSSEELKRIEKDRKEERSK